MKICAIIGNGFEELEAIGSIALLKRSGIEVDIYSLEKDIVLGKHNIAITNVLPLKQCQEKDYDMLLLPGGPHYEQLENNVYVIELIHNFYQKKKGIAAICASPTILGKMGLLQNRDYTCFTSMNEDFKGTFLDQYVVKDDFIITARSAAASIDFAFEIIEYLQGKEQRTKIEEQIYY
ncbi:MAG: DJ-1/PfpI family protein [Erysipelotrichaceae bacterium]|nr:DJ-1/PfpI family protein [Erysipelotrichaceae bacterium]